MALVVDGSNPFGHPRLNTIEVFMSLWKMLLVGAILLFILLLTCTSLANELPGRLELLFFVLLYQGSLVLYAIAFGLRSGCKDNR